MHFFIIRVLHLHIGNKQMNKAIKLELKILFYKGLYKFIRGKFLIKFKCLVTSLLFDIPFLYPPIDRTAEYGYVFLQSFLNRHIE